MTRVKICGITNKQDASFAVQAGADALGFIFAQSPRQVDPEKAHEIISLLPPFIHTVAVFVNEDPLTIKEIVEYCGIDLIQLHGDESPDLCSEFMPRTIKAFRLKDESSLKEIPTYHGRVRALLFDTYSKNKNGGTGETFDWDLAVKGKEEAGIPVILAGGLTPSNIVKAISIVRPYAVDVNSGVEKIPGGKSPDLIRRLMDAVRGIDMGGQTDD